MIGIKIEHELFKVGRFYRKELNGILVQAVKASLRRSLKPLERTSLKRVQKFRALNARLIRNRWFRTRKRLSGVDLRRIEAELEILNRPINLIDVVSGSKLPRPQAGIKIERRRPVRIRIIPGKSVKMKHGFIQKGPKSSRFQVFKRDHAGGFKLQSAPSLHELFEKEFFRRPIEREISKRLNKEFGQAYDYFLVKALAGK